MFSVIDHVWCPRISVVSMMFTNRELLTSSCTAPFPWRKSLKWHRQPNSLQQYVFDVHRFCAIRGALLNKSLAVIWPPPALSLLSTRFLAHSLPLKADSLFSKQVRENRKNKFREVDFEQNVDCLFSAVVVWLENIRNLEGRKWNGEHYQLT